MTFKEIKAGYPIYMMNRSARPIAVSQGKVVNVSTPHLPPLGTSLPQYGQTMLVDVTVEANGINKTYTIPEGLEVTYANDLVLSTSKEGIVREAQAMLASKEEALANVDVLKADISDLQAIIEQWNPEYREKKANEARFGAIEKEMGDMKSMMKELLTKLS